jgi:hypothetical protein
MSRSVVMLFPGALYEQLRAQLFPGDQDEHGAVVLAGLVSGDGETRLLAREVLIPKEGVDYRIGPKGYKALQPSFIHRAISKCRDRRLVYLAVHNHAGRDSVAFSDVDMASHERG